MPRDIVDWKMQFVDNSELVVAKGDELDPLILRPLIEDAERSAKAVGRTLVYTRLVTDRNGINYYPLCLLGRLSMWLALAFQAHAKPVMFTDPDYQQRRTPLPDDAIIDPHDGTVPR